MTGEGKLLVRIPDPVAVVGALGRGRLHEGRLGEPRLLRQGEHDLVADVVRVGDHRQPVAGQRPLREDVEPGDPMGHAQMMAILRRGPTPGVRFSEGRQTEQGSRDMDEKLSPDLLGGLSGPGSRTGSPRSSGSSR